MTCPSCDGTGEIDVTRECRPSEASGGLSELTGVIVCAACGGSGEVAEEA